MYSDDIRDIAELALLENKERNFESLIKEINKAATKGCFVLATSDVKHYPADLKNRLTSLGFAIEVQFMESRHESVYSEAFPAFEYLKIAW